MTLLAPRTPESVRTGVRSWSGRRLPWLLLISAAVFALDRLAKRWVVAHVPFGGAIPVIPHVLRISHWDNVGAAWSMFADSGSPHLVNHMLITVNVLIASLVLLALIYLGGRFNLITVALALILGGAMGNVHDRIAYGAVIDFIEVHIFSYHYPDFNIADSAVVTGACLLLLSSFLPVKTQSAERERSNSAHEEATDGTAVHRGAQ